MSTVANPTYEGLDDDAGIATIRHAIDVGINFFDTAPGYGDGASEIQLGKALHGIPRDRVVIANKINTPTLCADDVYAECEKSLERLQTDYMDLYQIHWPKNVVPIDETLSAMEDLVKQGKVRVLGVCNFGVEDLAAAMEISDLATNQIAYSLLARAAEYEVRDLCVQHGAGILCYSPVAQGLLTGRFSHADEVPEERARTRMFSKDRPQSRHDEPGCEAEAFEAIAGISRVCQRLDVSMSDVALAWLLHQPGVSAVLAGSSRKSQVEQNAAAADIELSAADLAELDELTRPVKEMLGPNLDMWVTESRIR
ncbi:MAG: aldo/keto reductase [Planctomycetota bacterium]